MCNCLAGFEPTSTAEGDSGRFSRGCRQKKAVQCGDRFLAVPGTSSLDKFMLVVNTMFDACAAECSSNWSCVTYAYANLRSSRSKGDMMRCLVWVGELVDTQKAGAGLGSDMLYLGLAGLDSSGLWTAWGEAALAGGVGQPGSVPSQRETRHRRRGIRVSGGGVHSQR
ncbi:hypothetical protein E2562_037333 [Oryza meyeriana var. granulata]|uniref:Apple domain-containing protein n=1 Tax=Oryza meyeriana var. granulata TaxID=110450 RepID=A0A6G1ETV1_9ORYZ|nr:hypothetical protein E2562_037333 [Oryza meyeriana var. granulata]